MEDRSVRIRTAGRPAEARPQTPWYRDKRSFAPHPLCRSSPTQGQKTLACDSGTRWRHSGLRIFKSKNRGICQHVRYAPIKKDRFGHGLRTVIVADHPRQHQVHKETRVLVGQPGSFNASLFGKDPTRRLLDPLETQLAQMLKHRLPLPNGPVRIIKLSTLIAGCQGVFCHFPNEYGRFISEGSSSD